MANLPIDQLLEMEKDRCKEKLKSVIIQRDKAAVTNMPLHGQFQTHLHRLIIEIRRRLSFG